MSFVRFDPSIVIGKQLFIICQIVGCPVVLAPLRMSAGEATLRPQSLESELHLSSSNER